jgi:hypothetical protein
MNPDVELLLKVAGQLRSGPARDGLFAFLRRRGLEQPL